MYKNESYFYMDVYGPYPSHLDCETYAIEQVTITNGVYPKMTLLTQLNSYDKYRTIFYKGDWVQIEIFTQEVLLKRGLYSILGWIKKKELSKMDSPIIAEVSLSNIKQPLSDGFIELSLSYLDVPYRWGGMSRAGTDCSGLVYQIFLSTGVRVPRFANGQFVVCKRINPKKLQVGDLIFGLHKNNPVHVMIYLGNEEMIESCGLPDVYTTRLISFKKKFNTSRRKMVNGYRHKHCEVRFGRLDPKKLIYV